jgi:hypothetical protein
MDTLKSEDALSNNLESHSSTMWQSVRSYIEPIDSERPHKKRRAEEDYEQKVITEGTGAAWGDSTPSIRSPLRPRRWTRQVCFGMVLNIIHGLERKLY